ncbi:membrane glycoprotein UL7 [Panine betaherpesvirus 2]|uniref:Membrane glycoprotein UL7 n=1 Tax=Panine betaherpesvirus 2 TaxID=188763 RepID=Q8QS79_9BETA|nr:membrane glycoprotein UL7 [Panine betaherpesvirus 2]AAM00658.1 membrane glycoprotein UL7 [Panine betaherpesvirus 2]QXV67761.1 membrane glycoprotein UL7 [Panine betaherpesvirus 2]
MAADPHTTLSMLSGLCNKALWLSICLLIVAFLLASSSTTTMVYVSGPPGRPLSLHANFTQDDDVHWYRLKGNETVSLCSCMVGDGVFIARSNMSLGCLPWQLILFNMTVNDGGLYYVNGTNGTTRTSTTVWFNVTIGLQFAPKTTKPPKKTTNKRAKLSERTGMSLFRYARDLDSVRRKDDDNNIHLGLVGAGLFVALVIVCLMGWLKILCTH